MYKLFNLQHRVPADSLTNSKFKKKRKTAKTLIGYPQAIEKKQNKRKRINTKPSKATVLHRKPIWQNRT